MSTDIKRISVEEGAALFERTGLRPTPGQYVGDGVAKCGCLVGAIVVDADGFDAAMQLNDVTDEEAFDDRAVELGYDPSYVGGLISGFDHPAMLADVAYALESRYQQGFIDGAAIRQRVLPVATEGQGA